MKQPKADSFTLLFEAWVEHELRSLYRQSTLNFEEAGWKWYLDRNLERIGSKNPWRPLSAEPASTGTIRATSPRPFTRLDEFGDVFRRLDIEMQAIIIVGHFGIPDGLYLLRDLRILHTEESWQALTTYFEQLSHAHRELTEILAACWLALRLAWRRRRLGIARKRASSKTSRSSAVVNSPSSSG
jgi:hypothetical protein